MAVAGPAAEGSMGAAAPQGARPMPDDHDEGGDAAPFGLERKRVDGVRTTFSDLLSAVLG